MQSASTYAFGIYHYPLHTMQFVSLGWVGGVELRVTTGDLPVEVRLAGLLAYVEVFPR
jgi:hypothetical protein